MNKLSVVVLTKNEELVIRKCLNALRFCDDIVIVDDYSTDNTVKKAEAFTKKILQRHLDNDFASQRNYGLEQARNEWVLFIDADEVISGELKSEIESVITKTSDIQACYVPRRDWWWGQELKHGEVQKVRNKGLIRLVKKNAGKWKGHVHEEFVTDKPTEKLKNYLDHYPHPTLKEFLHDINIYSTQRALELQEQGADSGILTILAYPFFKFLLVYIIYLGFLDGPAGFAYAFLMSFHSFLVRVKLYQYRYLS